MAYTRDICAIPFSRLNDIHPTSVTCLCVNYSLYLVSKAYNCQVTTSKVGRATLKVVNKSK